MVVGGGVYLMTASPENDATEEMEEVMESTNVSGEGTLRALIALGQDLSCDFVYDDEETSRSEGTVYLSGEKMRGDFTITMDGAEMESHIIRDGATGYTWGTTPAGSVAIMFELSEEDVEGEASSEQSIDLDQNLTYDCDVWSVDESKFVPPADLDFQNISAQMEMMMQGSAEVSGAQCGACEQIPDAGAQAQCKAALGCS